jgi:hypothetical protein
MGKWVKGHGLLLANIGQFAVFGGIIVSGANSCSEDQLAQGQPAAPGPLWGRRSRSGSGNRWRNRRA